MAGIGKIKKTFPNRRRTREPSKPYQCGSISWSRDTEIFALDDGSLKVRLKNQPEKGRARKEFLSVTGNYLGIHKISLKIVSGLMKNQKIIEVET